MRKLILFPIFIVLIILCACQTQPWHEVSRCQGSNANAQIILVDEEEFCVDEVIEGELCTNHLSGIVYVQPGIAIKEWEEIPNFLEGCDFEVEDGSIILVGDHNNTPYYNGCSCHTETNPID